ncbi:MAG: hypothetical protein F6J97_24780, partial [Leptolyngbya sp. SIO4C1]|nr:hypothetical protein [Leptolyngbya sp. SIO4C1]
SLAESQPPASAQTAPAPKLAHRYPRDWRPKGEVIAPLALRQQMRQEGIAELAHYRSAH